MQQGARLEPGLRLGIEHSRNGQLLGSNGSMAILVGLPSLHLA